jgi:hypothetical protein
LFAVSLPSGEGGHGHHTASAILALEAFDAAADSSRFPSHAKTLGSWQVKKIVWNTFQFGSNNTTSPDQLKLNVGVPLPLLGKSTGEFAAASRSMHKCQGFGTAAVNSEIIEYFKLLKGDSASKNLFAELDFSWNRLKDGGKMQKLIATCIRKFNPAKPEKSAELLGQILIAIRNIQANSRDDIMWKKVKMSEVQELLLAVCGIRIEVLAGQVVMVPANAQTLKVRMINRSAVSVLVEKIRFPDKDSLIGLELPFNQSREISHPFQLDLQAPLSSPSWLKLPSRENLYTLEWPNDLLDPATSREAGCEFTLRIAGVAFNTKVPLHYKWTDPVKGEQEQAVEVLPPVCVSFSEPLYLLSRGDTVAITITAEANIPAYKGKLRLNIPDIFQVEPSFIELDIQQARQRNSYQFKIHSPLRSFNQKLTAELEVEPGIWTPAQSIQRSAYDHLPPLHLLSPAEAQILKFESRAKLQSIAYIPGSGDDIAGILKQLGYMVTILPAESLGTADLSNYSAIVTGVRAYNVSEEPGNQHPKLMQFVQQGGTLLVQYNTNSRIGPMKSKMGPYPFEISRNRVTDENAPVNFLLPSHPVLHHPYPINPSDFEGWVQERGIYFAEQCAPEYQKPLAFSDPGESALDGSLIIVQHGKGYFVYTGLSFFRQLPAGVPGAIRLFINLLSIPAEK